MVHKVIETKFLVLFVLAVASGTLLTSHAMMANFLDEQYALAQTQNQTSTANQTAVGAAQNQTSMANQTSGPFGNLTSADFELVEENLDTARQALFDNDTTQAHSSLGWANNELFLATDELENEPFDPLKTNLRSAQDAIVNNDDATALEELNLAGIELLKIRQQLTAGEGEEEASAE